MGTQLLYALSFCMTTNMSSLRAFTPGTWKFYFCICNRSRAICVSPWAMGFGVNSILQLKRDSSFPLLYSWCSAFDPNAHIITYKLRAACITGRLKFMRNTKVILNMSCSNYSIQGEGEPRRRVPWCSLPELRVDNPP